MSRENGTEQRELAVENGLGLHARAAARIAETLESFDCEVMLVHGEAEADARSVLSLLTLDAPLGSQVVAKATGPQADEALDALEGLFADKFGEGR